MEKIREECGVFGNYEGKISDVARTVYYALALQHRGQESCGIEVSDEGVIHSQKDIGLVPEVFTNETLGKIGTHRLFYRALSYRAFPQRISKDKFEDSKKKLTLF